MTKLSFLFLATLYVTISIMSFSTAISVEIQVGICAVFIALVGIPHGAIDNILFLKTTTVSPTRFYFTYLATIAGYICFWIFFPVLSLVLFLGVSAYHFGESQLSNYFDKQKFWKVISYFFWGLNILSSLIYFNQIELISVFSAYHDLTNLISVFNEQVHFWILAISSLFLFLAGLTSKIYGNISLDRIFKEVTALLLIHLAFILLPLLSGFTLYFVILHSGKVLLEEYLFLKKTITNMSFKNFLVKLVPFSAISIIGGVFLFGLIYVGVLNISYILLSIILISVITLPHAVVMQRFYSVG